MTFYVKYNNLLSITVVKMFAKVLGLDLREVTGYEKKYKHNYIQSTKQRRREVREVWLVERYA